MNLIVPTTTYLVNIRGEKFEYDSDEVEELRTDPGEFLVFIDDERKTKIVYIKIKGKLTEIDLPTYPYGLLLTAIQKIGSYWNIDQWYYTVWKNKENKSTPEELVDQHLKILHNETEATLKPYFQKDKRRGRYYIREDLNACLITVKEED